MYTNAATAPARCAFVSFVSNVQSPRKMKAIRPCRAPLGIGRHARPFWSIAATDASCAVIGAGELKPDPGTASTGAAPSIAALAPNTRPFLVAPTVIAEGAVPGEPIVFGSGPSFPAATTTTMPSAAALSSASTSMSSSKRVASREPRLRLITSIPSATASSMALRTAASVALSFTPGLPKTL